MPKQLTWSIKQPLTDKQLEILHDHYKETFARLREAEASRDRLFLGVIGLFALLSVEIGYPAATGGSLGKLSILGGELSLQALPLPALLTATWVLTLAIGLRYCQKSILVNRQYPYLHSIEEAISPAVGGGDLYQREGVVYLRGYPWLLNVAWVAYVIIFPLIVIGATIGLLWREFLLPYTFLLRFVDTVVALALISFFSLYCIVPGLVAQLSRLRTRLSHKKQLPGDADTDVSRTTKARKP